MSAPRHRVGLARGARSRPELQLTSYVLASIFFTYWCATMYQWYSVPTGAPLPEGALWFLTLLVW